MSGAATNTGKKNFLTNHEWLSRHDEIKIPLARRSRKWGIFILSQLLSHDVMSEEIYPSLFLSRPGVTFPFLRGKFHHIFFACSTKICSMVKVHIDCFSIFLVLIEMYCKDTFLYVNLVKQDIVI